MVSFERTAITHSFYKKRVHERKLAIKGLPSFLHITYKFLQLIYMSKRRCWCVHSMFWGWSKATAGGAVVEGMLPDAPFSAGGGTPHLPSDSRGSKTWTLPSVRPMANWLGSWGCAAIARGYTVELQKMNEVY